MNSTDPITDESFDQLLLTVGCALLSRITRDIAGDALSPDQVAQYGQVYAAIFREQVAREKCRASVEIAKINADSRVQAAQHRPSRKKRRGDEEEDLEAPWGRKKDGTPYTHKEFMTTLGMAVKDVYGITLPDNFCDPKPYPPEPPYDPDNPYDEDEDDEAADDADEDPPPPPQAATHVR
jgi:hypothetical protein